METKIFQICQPSCEEISVPFHFRDGKQIGFLALDEHYNFEFQEAKNLGKTKTVKMVCIYDKLSCRVLSCMIMMG